MRRRWILLAEAASACLFAIATLALLLAWPAHGFAQAAPPAAPAPAQVSRAIAPVAPVATAPAQTAPANATPASSAPAPPAVDPTSAAATPSAAPAAVPADPATAAAASGAAGVGAAAIDTVGTSAPAEPLPEAEVSTAADGGALPTVSMPIRYLLEGIEVRGNEKTRTEIIKRFVNLEPSEPFAVDDPSIERSRFRLLGTGWFDDVKLSLSRGKERGWVVLVVEVKERNTLVIDRFVAGLARVVTSSTNTKDTLRPYVGLGITESNLLGLGVGVSATGVVSGHQYGIDLGYNDPMVFGTGFAATSRLFYNDAREFFGHNPVVSIGCPPTMDPDEQCDPDIKSKSAVVIYHRGGGGFGTGHDISGNLRYTLDWLGEVVDVLSVPFASDQHGSEVGPIDFRIHNGTSFVSSIRLGLIYDNRDHPVLPTRGSQAAFSARFATGLLGSSYDFARFEGSVRHWFPLPWGHTLSLGGFAGTVFGDAPFFYDFYAADLSDLLPSRVLELNLDHRRSLNLLHTDIVEMDMENLAARLDFEYRLPLHRGFGFFRGVDLYGGAGLFLLADRDDLKFGIPGYHGLSRVPVDLTFDVGLQADTEIGLLKIGFSSLMAFFPNAGQEPQ